MEQRSTKGSSNGVPGQVKKPVSDKDLLASFGLEFPDFNPLPEMKMPEFTDFSSDLQKRADKMMAEAQQKSERMLAESRRWFEEGKLNLENFRSDMDFTEYTDSEGYHVMEGRSKDGYRIIQKTKRNGNHTISKLEIYKDGELSFQTNSNENKFSYRDTTGKMVEVAKESHVEKDRTPKGRRLSYEESYRRTIHTSHAKVIKGKKKTTKGWKWLFIIAIAVLVIYFLFLR